MTTEKLQPLNLLSEVEFGRRYGEIISMGVLAVEKHLVTGAPATEQTVGEALSILYGENPGHHLSLIDRQSLEVED